MPEQHRSDDDPDHDIVSQRIGGYDRAHGRNAARTVDQRRRKHGLHFEPAGNGQLTITVIFKVGTNPDTALLLTRSRVEDTLTRLPADVQLQGVQVKKTIQALLLGVHVYSPDGSRSPEYLSNYMLKVRDQIARLPGVSDSQLFGERQYAMRIWIDPDKAASYKISASKILAALRAQNAAVSTGVLNQPPVSNQGTGAYQINVEARGRLSTPEQFGDVVVKSDTQGRVTRIRDIGRVEHRHFSVRHRLSRPCAKAPPAAHVRGIPGH